MIKGTNLSASVFNDDILPSDINLDKLSTTDEVIENLIQRRQNVLRGGVNCIPLPFERFRQELPGIEQGTYVVVSANQKVKA